MPYETIQDYGSYEHRRYPAVSMVCTYHKTDQAGDPFAGLEKVNPWVLMQSRRFQKTPSSIMFMRLFRYISGVNQAREEVEMTVPVPTLHKVVRQDELGNVEKLLMCFYLPSLYQPHHTHDDNDAVARHDSAPPPAPMEDSKVFLHTRPEMEVYVRKFGGFAMTAATWEKQRQALLYDLIGKKVRDGEFFSTSYNSPMVVENRRNEVWVQATEGEAPHLASVLEEVLGEEEE